MVKNRTLETPEDKEVSDASWLDAHRYPVWFRVLVAAIFLIIAFVIVSEKAIFLAIGIVVIAPLERAFQRHKIPILRPELLTDFMHIWVTTLLSVVPSYYLAKAAQPYQITAIVEAIRLQPGWLLAVEAFALRELLIY